MKLVSILFAMALSAMAMAADNKVCGEDFPAATATGNYLRARQAVVHYLAVETGVKDTALLASVTRHLLNGSHFDGLEGATILHLETSATPVFPELRGASASFVAQCDTKRGEFVVLAINFNYYPVQGAGPTKSFYRPRMTVSEMLAL